MDGKILQPVSFDIETSGFLMSDVVTTAGFMFPLGAHLVLNTGGRDVGTDELVERVRERSETHVKLATFETEAALLEHLRQVTLDKITPQERLLVGYNCERWRDGFDFRFLRTRCGENDVPWVFPDVPYSDMMEVFDTKVNLRVTEERTASGLEETYDAVIGEPHCDPFDDSEEAVKAWESGNFTNLLLHNLADVKRTKGLAEYAQRYVPIKDFRLKNLGTPVETL